MTTKQIKEREAEEAVARQSHECMIEEAMRRQAGPAVRQFRCVGAVTGRFPASQPNLSTMRA